MVAIYVLLCAVISLVSAEHTGAYSSPQYAKKMYPKGYDTNALLPREKPPILFKRHTSLEQEQSIDRYDMDLNRFDSDMNETAQYGRSSLFDSASSFLSSAGGKMVSSLAEDFIARSTGSSQVGFDCITQVLSLNLTNLVILIVLKALILAAGFFGAGAWKGHHYARSLDDNKNATFITEDEMLMYLSYLTGQQTKNYGCLYRLACKRPHQAGLYAAGAELLLQGTKLVQGNSIELEPYEQISKGIKEAAQWGEKERSCDVRYKCGEQN